MPTIALVDDDRNILTSLRMVLEAEGYKTQTYNEGASALDGFAERPPAPAHLATAAGGVEDKSKVLERGKLKMDPERHTCVWENRPVTLTVTEFLILQSLAARPGVVKSRDALMDAASDDQVYVDDRTIDSHIKRLRKKFKAVDQAFDGIEK